MKYKVGNKWKNSTNCDKLIRSEIKETKLTESNKIYQSLASNKNSANFFSTNAEFLRMRNGLINNSTCRFRFQKYFSIKIYFIFECIKDKKN